MATCRRSAGQSGRRISKHRLESSRAAAHGRLPDRAPQTRLQADRQSDGLRDYEVSLHLKTVDMGKRIYCLDCVDSTNLFAKQEARQGAPHGTLVVAEEQTAGRGRLERTWTSWPGASLCFSLVLRPNNVAPADAPQLTHVVALAVARVLRRDLGIDARLKWPNDVVVDGRKVCGILVEMSCELDLIHYVILGVGINVHRHTGHVEGDLAGRLQRSTSSWESREASAIARGDSRSLSSAKHGSTEALMRYGARSGRCQAPSAAVWKSWLPMVRSPAWRSTSTRGAPLWCGSRKARSGRYTQAMSRHKSAWAVST